MHHYSPDSIFNSLSDIAKKNITIMGLGLNGGGLATARFLLKHGANVLVTDQKTEAALQESVDLLRHDPSIDQNRLQFVLGEHRLQDFSAADLVIKNPGVKIDGNKYLAAAKHIETDLSIFLRFSKAPIIAVTGSKGKSSTVSAIHYGLQQAGFSSFLGGNITVSPLTFLHETSADTPVVLELSSWQLADLCGRNILKPHIAVITTIVPDHQNWYNNSMEAYVADKKLIYADQTKADYTLCKYNDNWGNVFASETPAQVLRYCNTNKLPHTQDGCWLQKSPNGVIGYAQFKGKTQQILGEKLLVPGMHMKENILNAALVMTIMGVEAKKTQDILAKYPGIEHRLEFFHTWKSINFYNDSAATVPEATVEAVAAFSQNVHLICGGTDKELDFTPFSQEAHKAKSLYLLQGTGTDKLVPLLQKKGTAFNGPYSDLESLLLALKVQLEQQKQASQDEVVVFSPGATSFGLFKNEFDRGKRFKDCVKKIF